MSFSDKPREPREPRTPRRARPRLSLKMQAIGFLSRREHSRQELRAKLLDSLRKRAREDAALEAATEKAARELADALRDQPSNGIDDAFAPPSAGSLPAPAPLRARETRPPAPRSRAGAGAEAGSQDTTPPRAALATLTLASGAPLPASLRASLVTSRATAVATPPRQSADSPERGAIPTAFGESPDEALTDEVLTDKVLADKGLTEKALADDGPGDEAPAHADPEAAVDELLDWLVANKYLSETRFVESRVNARSRKQGTLLIKLELSRHGLALEPEQAAQLRETEFARAQALWQRKFGELTPDARLRAKQARFLAARGFAADVVRRVVGGEEEF